MEWLKHLSVNKVNTGIDVNGGREGIMYIIESNTLIYSAEYLNNKQHGVERSWYANKQLRYEKNFIDGKLHGNTKFWYANGKLLANFNYIDNKPHGDQCRWNINGTILAGYHYINGVSIG
jgi:antitoxin component YwqK of YwqJK toxin-antitoxin module